MMEEKRKDRNISEEEDQAIQVISSTKWMMIVMMDGIEAAPTLSSIAGEEWMR